MLVALLRFLVGAKAPILLLSYVCETEDDDVVHRHELMVAAGMARSRRRGSEIEIREASKVLNQAELAELQRAVARLPAPFVADAGAGRTLGDEFASLQIVASQQAWNISYPPFDPGWHAFEPVLQWIRKMQGSSEFQKVRAKVCGSQRR